jgi:hypothetical protein
MMMKAIALLYLEGANVRIPFEVELHSGSDEGDLNDIVNEMFPHLQGSDCYGEFIEENGAMTKLQELKAAIDDTYDAAKAASYDTSAAAWAAYVAACDAYYDELMKQEENSDDI